MKRRRIPLGVGFAVKVWPIENDPRWSWLSENGYVISVYDRKIWSTRADARAMARSWTFRSKLVRIRFVRRETPPIGTGTDP